MENTIAQGRATSTARFITALKALGPGILMATAAIGGSHLVASTQAGARFGWQLAILIIAANAFKYPFFRAGIAYTMATDESLLKGYLRMGKGYLYLSWVINFFSSMVNTAALIMFAASLLGYFLPVKLSLIVLSGIVLVMSLAIVVAGQFSLLNKVSKFIMLALSVATVGALIIAIINGPVAPAGYHSPSPWQLATIGFLVITMGWMPMPIEMSCISSLWLVKQRRTQVVTRASALFDFNLGYVSTAILALVFLSLGALVLRGSGTDFANGGVGFTHQLVSIYAQTIGSWSRYLIAMIAFFCIFGSVITVMDGYARMLNESIRLVVDKDTDDERSSQRYERYSSYWVIFIGLSGYAIVLFFHSALLVMLGFAMTLAFMTTPMFAWLNHRLLNSDKVPQQLRPSFAGQLINYAGLIYLFAFLLLFIWWKWLM
ncbi:NRAMP family divalent metal transporter [Celerinatantimonas sp. MCCC 1A17872]|uniref:NRAMP family divalent metal transporter n=1 Tax=Celerinatantimonas sp. MCCC 1A17872 TaxID=3177514 RepID=UPI0038C4BCD4